LIGFVGRRFWKSLKLLQTIEENKVFERLEIFSKNIDA
jgi:hypothetical protein